MYFFNFKEENDDVELANLINLFQNVSFKGTGYALENSNFYKFIKILKVILFKYFRQAL